MELSRRKVIKIWRTSLANEYVIDIDQYPPVETETQLPVAEVAERVEEQESVQPELQSGAEKYALHAVPAPVVLDHSRQGDSFFYVCKTLLDTIGLPFTLEYD